MNLKDHAQGQIAYHRERAQEWRETLAIVKQLPKTIKDLDGELTHSYGEVYTLNVSGEDAMEMLFDFGVVFEKEYHFYGTWNTDTEDNKDFRINGKKKLYVDVKGQLKEFDLRVYVRGMPKPETCEIVAEEVTETRYKAICKETKETLS